MKYVLEVLFPYFFLLYAFDCLTVIKVHHVVLTSLIGRKFDLKRSGVHLTGLLPTSQTIITHDLPIHYTQDGIYVVLDESCSNNRIDKAEDFNFIKFQEIQLIETEGKNIRINHSHAINTPSSSSARCIAKFLNKLKILPPPDRNENIRMNLSDSFDLNAIKKIAASNSKSFSIIKILSSYLFVLVFFVLPLSLYSDLSEFVQLNAIVICMLLSYFLLLLATFLTLKKLYESDDDHPMHTLLSILFSPVNAIHILSYLTKDLFIRFNHLAVAAYFMSRDAFKELAAKEICLIDYFEKEIDRYDWQEYWRLKRELLLGLLDELNISLVEISAPPEKQDQTAISYCPVCRTEYRQQRHFCIDCEVALKEYNPAISGMSMDPNLAAKTNF